MRENRCRSCWSADYTFLKAAGQALRAFPACAAALPAGELTDPNRRACRDRGHPVADLGGDQNFACVPREVHPDHVPQHAADAAAARRADQEAPRAPRLRRRRCEQPAASEERALHGLSSHYRSADRARISILAGAMPCRWASIPLALADGRVDARGAAGGSAELAGRVRADPHRTNTDCAGRGVEPADTPVVRHRQEGRAERLSFRVDCHGLVEARRSDAHCWPAETVNVTWQKWAATCHYQKHLSCRVPARTVAPRSLPLLEAMAPGSRRAVAQCGELLGSKFGAIYAERRVPLTPGILTSSQFPVRR